MRSHDYLALDQDPSLKGVWIPAAGHLIAGTVAEWAASANVEAVPIPGYWYEKDGSDMPTGTPPIPGEKVVFALHSGAYALNSAHPDDRSAAAALGILEYAPSCITRCLALEYRLSKASSRAGTYSNPFPAALVDAIAGYSYLVNEVGFLPEDIIIAGISAGGNLALALTLYLAEHQSTDQIPQIPGGLVLCSPWVDLGPIPQDSSSSVHINIRSDFLDVTGTFMRNCISNFVGPLGLSAAEHNPYVSPASLSPSLEKFSFAGFPRTFILCGGVEVLRDEIHRLRDKLVADLGLDCVEFVEIPDAIHSFMEFRWHEPERTEALRAIGKWLGLGQVRVSKLPVDCEINFKRDGAVN